MKLTLNCVCYINLCINLLVLPSAGRERRPIVLYLILLHLLQSIAAHFQQTLTWLTGEKYYH